jgi:hypothetical protein
MGNITLTVDDTVIKQARRVALERDTTLTAMVRDYLEQVAASDLELRRRRAMDLKEAFAALGRPLGTKDWNRDDLHA